MFFKRKDAYILDAFNKAKQWIENNTLDGGILHSSSVRKPYPEVTGYYIPSLIKWGEKELACSYGDWLLSIQTPEGAWQEADLKTIYTFDTGQILKGLYALIPFGEQYEIAFLKGCDFLLSQIDQEGRIHTPTMEHFSGSGSEYIHLYAIEALKLASEKYGRMDCSEAVNRALNYYLNKKNLLDFNILSHFHAYVVEALIDLGDKNRAIQGLDGMKKYQRSDGSMPAFSNARWVCLPAIFQYAVCYYKLGMLEEGNRLFDYGISKQNPSGGFYGSYGWFANYFQKNEISWAIKYFLDALDLKLALEFAKEERAECFLAQINKSDQRYRHLFSIAQSLSSVYAPIKLLDVGCGKGRFIHALMSDKVNADVIAMDISDKLFNYLPEKCEQIVGSILNIPKESNFFDIVFVCETLEHAVNIEAAVSELVRVCKPGGVVIILGKELSRKKNIQLETWEQWFEKNDLGKMMEKNKLQVDMKNLLTTDGPPIFAWTGKKSIHA